MQTGANTKADPSTPSHLPYAAITLSSCTRAAGGHLLVPCFRSPATVSGQWEVNSRHQGKLGNFFQRRNWRAHPSHQHPPPVFLLGPRLSASGERGSFLALGMCHAGCREKSPTSGMAEGRTEAAPEPSPPRAPHQPWAHRLLHNDDPGLTWLLGHKLSLRVEATEHFPDSFTKGRLKTSYLSADRKWNLFNFWIIPLELLKHVMEFRYLHFFARHRDRI